MGAVSPSCNGTGMVFCKIHYIHICAFNIFLMLLPVMKRTTAGCLYCENEKGGRIRERDLVCGEQRINRRFAARLWAVGMSEAKNCAKAPPAGP